VEIDLTTGAVAKDEACWPPLLQCTHELREKRGKAFNGFAPYRKVEVIVRPRLFSEQRIHAPAAVDPPLDVRSVEPSEDIQNVISIHRARALVFCYAPASRTRLALPTGAAAFNQCTNKQHERDEEESRRQEREYWKQKVASDQDCGAETESPRLHGNHKHCEDVEDEARRHGQRHPEKDDGPASRWWSHVPIVVKAAFRARR
jgi:hypothetical protein